MLLCSLITCTSDMTVLSVFNTIYESINVTRFGGCLGPGSDLVTARVFKSRGREWNDRSFLNHRESLLWRSRLSYYGSLKIAFRYHWNHDIYCGLHTLSHTDPELSILLLSRWEITLWSNGQVTHILDDTFKWQGWTPVPSFNLLFCLSCLG